MLLDAHVLGLHILGRHPLAALGRLDLRQRARKLDRLQCLGRIAVELDDQIPEELYRATAQVIAFVLSLRGELGRPRREGGSV